MTKYLTFIYLTIFCFSCSQTADVYQSEKIMNEKYGLELIENDYLKYANHEDIDLLKKEILDSFNIYAPGIQKFTQIDAEELAEFNLDFFVPQLNKILKKRNVHLDVEKATDYKKTNDIWINGDKINLYTKNDLENQTFWDTAARNFFEKVNEILQTKKSDEKFYLLYAGNDLSTLLLTSKQYETIKKYYKNDKGEMPYLP